MGCLLEVFCRLWEFVDWKGIVLPSSLVTGAERGSPADSVAAGAQASAGALKAAGNHPRQMSISDCC